MGLISRCVEEIDDQRVTSYSIFGCIFMKKVNTSSFRKTYVFNFLYRKTVVERVCTVNALNLKEVFDIKKITYLNKEIDIIIPVYNGYDYLEPLFRSIKENTDLNYNMFVVDDASPDSRIIPLLREVLADFSCKVVLIESDDNVGFVKSVNKALELTANDVVLVNTDVVVPKKWASKLFRQIFANDNVASVTPFTNAATIYSIPQINVDNKFEDDLDAVNRGLELIGNPGDPIELWTGVGFCMAMSRSAIDSVGVLDEIFNKGYGEENDWCLRAMSKGYVNTLASDLFVWHKHGGSFPSHEKEMLIQRNISIIHKRYPKCKRLMKQTNSNSRFLSMRFIAEILYLNSCAKRSEVWFDHTWGGGTESYTFYQFEKYKDNTLFIRVQNDRSKEFTVSYYYKACFNILILKSIEELNLLLDQLSFQSIIINNLAGYNSPLNVLKEIEKIKNRSGATVSFRAHDFQTICPNIVMLDSDNVFCNSQNLDACALCYSKSRRTMLKVNDVDDWHRGWDYLFTNVVDEAIFFSNSTKNIFSRLYPSINSRAIVSPHTMTALRRVEHKAHRGINIAVVGGMSKHKGALILYEMGVLLGDYDDVSIYIVGAIKRKYASNMKVLGRYERADLPKIMEDHNIDLVFIPSIWPETFSYTTSEAILMDMPVACFDLGAPAERVGAYNKGLVISELNAKVALREIVEFVHKSKSQS